MRELWEIFPLSDDLGESRGFLVALAFFNHIKPVFARVNTHY